MFLRIAWGPVVGALLASGWWALGVWGCPSWPDTGWHFVVLLLTSTGTWAISIALIVCMIDDCMKSFQDVNANTDDEPDEETE